MSLTEQQQAEVCAIIDLWYVKWKDLIVDEGVAHKLGFAKEELKGMVCE